MLTSIEHLDQSVAARVMDSEGLRLLVVFLDFFTYFFLLFFWHFKNFSSQLNCDMYSTLSSFSILTYFRLWTSKFGLVIILTFKFECIFVFFINDMMKSPYMRPGCHIGPDKYLVISRLIYLTIIFNCDIGVWSKGSAVGRRQ